MAASSQLAGARTDARLEDGVWPERRSRILDWLMIESRGQRFLDNILVEDAAAEIGRAHV